MFPPFAVLANDAIAQFVRGPLMFLPLLVLMYLVVFRPQSQQRRKTQEMLANLKSGDKVVTSGGLYGTIVGFRDSVVQLQVAPQVRVDVSRTAIAGLQPDESDVAKSADGAKKKS